MKEGKSLFCRLLSLAVTVLMLSAMMILPASAVYTYPDSGVIISEDYESYDDGGKYSPKTDGYHFSRGGITIKDFNGNKVWDVNPSSNPGNTNFNQGIELNACTSADATGIAQVDTGKLVMEYDLYFPTPAAGKQMVSGQKVGHSINFYANDWNGSAPDKKRAYLTYSQMAADASGTGHVAQIWFPETNIGAPQQNPLSNAVTLSLDTWHHVVHYIDYDKNEMLHYVDGNLAAVVTEDIAEKAPFYLTYIYTNTTNTTTADFANYIDNIKIERITGQEPLSLSVKKVGADYVELLASHAVDFSGLTAGDFNLKVFNGSNVGAPTSVSYIGNVLRLTYPSLEPYTSYELYLNKKLGSYLDSSLSVPAGSKFTVFTGVKEKEDVLFEQDFENVTFPTEDGTQNVSWMNIVASDAPADASVADFSDMTGWSLTEIENEYEYAEEATVNGSKAMRLHIKTPYNSAQGSVSLVLPFGQTITEGVVTVEFDAAPITLSGYTRYGFGLHDSEDNVTAYDPWNSWGDATYFGGLANWSGLTKELHMNSVDKPHILPDCYIYYDTDTNPNGTNWKVHEATSISQSFKVSNDPTAAGTNMKKWKYVIDLDNQTYSFYLNGNLQKTLDYIPGGESGSYDAFVATVAEMLAGTALTRTPNELYIDNVKVYRSTSVPALTGVTFMKYDGTKFGHNATMSAGTRQIELQFSEPMTSASLSNITMPGANFTRQPDGNKVILDLPNCLSPDTPYTLTIGKDLANSEGTTLGVDTVLQFTTDSGEKIINSPVLTANGRRVNVASSILLGETLTAELNLINTTGIEQDAFLLVASYKDGMLASAFTGELAPTQNSAKLEARFTADEGFVNSDSIKMFVLNNAEDVQPLINAVEIIGGNAAEISLSSADGEGLFITASVPTGVTPTVVEKGGRNGWQINPGVLNESYIGFDLDDEFMNDMKPEDTATILVDYYDEKESGFGVLYNDRNDAIDMKFQSTNQTSSWKTTSIDIYGAKFDNSPQLGADDFQIIVNDEAFSTAKKKLMGTAPHSVVIGNVAVIKNSTKAPFDIVENTPHAGNVFFTDEALTFDIDYNDISSTGGYTEADVSYTVYNHSGAKVWETTSQIVGNKDVITVPALPYGVYTLEVEITGGNILQKETIDFSYSMKASASNMRFGTNVHFDWHEALTTDDVDDILELIKASGYGFVRSKVEWMDVQSLKDGAYQPHALYWYGSQQADELGLEMLTILQNGNPAYDVYSNLETDELRQAYADACAYIVGELKAYTDYYTNPNEMNLNWYNDPNWTWEKSATNYAAYSKAANEAIKAAYPDAKIISGAVAGSDVNWSNILFENGLLANTDGFSGHDYQYRTASENRSDDIFANLSTALKTADPNQEFWVTENGWPTLNLEGAGADSQWRATEVEQAKWYARSFAFYSDYDPVDKYFHYCFPNSNVGYFWQEDNFGIVRSHDYRTPFAVKPAFITTAAFNTIVGEATCYGNQSSLDVENFYVNKFVTKAGDEVYMLWRTEAIGNQSYSFATSQSQLEIYDMYGNKSVVDVSNGSYNLTVTDEPIYVKAIN